MLGWQRLKVSYRFIWKLTCINWTVTLVENWFFFNFLCNFFFGEASNYENFLKILTRNKFSRWVAKKHFFFAKSFLEHIEILYTYSFIASKPFYISYQQPLCALFHPDPKLDPNEHYSCLKVAIKWNNTPPECLSVKI